MPTLSMRQGITKGLGHAILCACPVIAEPLFAVVLLDVILDTYTADQAKENLVAIKKRFEEMRALQIIVEGLAQEDLSKYGIVDCGAVTSLEGTQTASMTRIIEKPSLEDAPSNLAVVGRYVLYKSIWPLLQKALGVGDKILLTVVIAILMDEQSVEAFFLTGASHDWGDKLGYTKANVEYAIHHTAFGEKLKSHLRVILDCDGNSANI